MVLESIIDPFKAEKKPWELFFIGFVYSAVAVFLALWIFRQHASLIMVFLTVMACIPLIYNTIKLEEKRDLIEEKESVLLKGHARALSFLVFLFLGITVSLTLWYIVLPGNITQSLFNVQTKTIAEINSQITGGAIVQLGLFSKIFFNNIKVMIFCLLFSFIYGAGAIFILTWNASVIAAAIGNFIRTNISSTASYFAIAPFGLLRYLLHGIPEIIAYFTAGLAGGIISIAIIRHDFGSKKFERIVLDSTDLMILAIVTLFIAALMEVYLTPLLF